MPGVGVRMTSYGDRIPTQERYNSEESLEDNQSTASSTESRQSDFLKKEHEFIPTRSSGILASKPAANPAQFTRINSNPLLISAQKQMLLVEEVKKKKEEVKIGEDIPDWQSNLDGWKMRRRKQSEEAIGRVSEMRRVTDPDLDSSAQRKSSLGRKISLQIENNDQINFDDLGDEDETEEDKEAERPQHRRKSRGLSEEKPIPEEEEEEERVVHIIEEEDEKEQIEDELEEEVEEEESNETGEMKVSNPYENAIQGYKSFALSQNTHTTSLSSCSSSLSKEHSPSPSSPSPSISTSSSSMSPTTSTLPSSPPRTDLSKKKEEQWEEKIETLVAPVRRASTEVSETMKQKMASFTGSPVRETGKVGREARDSREGSTQRTIKPDNKFQDKLRAFKTIETLGVKEVSPAPTEKINRRISEPLLSRFAPPVPQTNTLHTSSSSSSFMNTMQNAKFFQQNSLGSEEPDEEDNKAMEEALEESFNVLEEGKDEAETLVFSADDFIPAAGKTAPPQEKPPPLPAAPPPPLPEAAEEETEIDKQEREIIESLEREEQEHKKYLETITSSVATSSFSASSSSISSSSLLEKNLVSSQSEANTSKSWSIDGGTGAVTGGANLGEASGAVSSTVTGVGSGVLSSRMTGGVQGELTGAVSSTATGAGVKKQDSQSSVQQPRKKEKEAPRDYSKHWLIQEAEQRRIAEAKQKQNLNLSHSSSSSTSSGIDKIENINNNNNNNGEYLGGYGDKRREHNVSDNIYANVDAANLNFNKNHSSFSSHMPEPNGALVQIPGPQIPPRLGDSGQERQERVLSVSGRKKCSHCKEELGRGAAMIIESLRLFYHIRCFKCCVCSIQLGNGEQGTDVRVRNNRLHCHNCYSNDEGLKFSKV